MRHFLVAFTLLIGIASLNAQNYILGGGGIGFHNSMEVLNGVVDRFNEDFEHEIPSFKFAPGYELGFARYSRYTLVELKWVGEGRRNNSKVPGNFIENASVAWRYHYANISVGYRPFEKRYFTVGLGLNLGQLVTRYSFGGDFDITNKIHSLSSELFVDYAIKVRWRRNKRPYLIRLRPFYQFFYFPVDLKNLETNMNATPDVQFNELLQRFNNTGIRLSLLIPITGEVNMEYTTW